MENIIEVSNVKKEFGKGKENRTLVLNGASMSVKKGEFVSLMGASGSGKSTLLYLIGGLDRDFTGDISVCGKNITRIKEKELSAIRLNKIGFRRSWMRYLESRDLQRRGRLSRQSFQVDSSRE